jgi:hypothetical protein
MKINKNVLISLGLFVLVASIYRVLPNRPPGFAPQIAMALFGGAFFMKNKKWAFILPLLSMFISDVIYQVLYTNGYTQIAGFYSGQLLNYILIGSITLIGFLISDGKIAKLLLASVSAPTAFFFVSNTIVWIGNGGYQRPRTFTGLVQCLADGLPFYQNSLISTVVFGALLFGGYSMLTKTSTQTSQIA